jgi:metal-dependent hydrolase (beta-lactamase superfamily II)
LIDAGGRAGGYRQVVFFALIEADSYIVVDTGLHSETVLRNAHDLNIDLSNVATHL